MRNVAVLVLGTYLICEMELWEKQSCMIGYGTLCVEIFSFS